MPFPPGWSENVAVAFKSNQVWNPLCPNFWEFRSILVYFWRCQSWLVSCEWFTFIDIQTVISFMDLGGWKSVTNQALDSFRNLFLGPLVGCSPDPLRTHQPEGSMVFFSPKSEEAEDSDIQTMATVFWQDDGCGLTHRSYTRAIRGSKGGPWPSKLKLFETKPLDFAIIWTHSGITLAIHFAIDMCILFGNVISVCLSEAISVTELQARSSG